MILVQLQMKKPKKQVKEYGANNPPQGSTTLQKVDPKQAQAVAQATSALKSATGSGCTIICCVNTTVSAHPPSPSPITVIV